MTTMPIVLAGAMTMSLNVTAPLSADAAVKRPSKPKTDSSATLRQQLTAAKARSAAATSAPASIPATYTVAAGDTVSAIAARFGVSTASLLALNGLGWKSLIFPGQILKIGGTPASPPLAPAAPAPAVSVHTIARGDTVSKIAAQHGVSVQALLDANGLGWSSIIYPGQTLTIPSAGGAAPAPAIQLASQVTAAPTPSASTGSYTIASGDTVSRIAERFGVTVPSLLAANAMTAQSVIYSGRKIAIPAVVTTQDGSGVTVLTPEMLANARIIVDVGHQLGVPDRGIVVALAAAMQESSLRNISYGDRDSVGLFQQRPSAGWGTTAQLLSPSYAARLFYGGPSNPNRGVTRGLLEIAGWQTMTVTQAAQSVQISAHPDAYAKWEKSAWSWLSQIA
ncbi:MAG TPA: LysM peptidoglycan-binding domain-containing protein [Pseudolysinimonas sp.]|nr:LysM peptidoglycan-binding domain-containing protein [Pseudolysinimonas sp.]